MALAANLADVHLTLIIGTERSTRRCVGMDMSLFRPRCVILQSTYDICKYTSSSGVFWEAQQGMAVYFSNRREQNLLQY